MTLPSLPTVFPLDVAAESEVSILQSQLLTTIQRQYGPLVGGADLRQILGFHSPDAFRQAVSRGTLPVPVFAIPNRRGKFALTQDLAVWLAELKLTHTINQIE